MVYTMDRVPVSGADMLRDWLLDTYKKQWPALNA